MNILRRLAKYAVRALLGLFLFLLITLPLLLYILLGTDSGFRWLVDKGQTYAPGELQIGSLQGNLIDGCEFRELSYQQQDLQLAVNEFALDWQPAALFGGEVHIQQIKLDQVRVKLPPSSETEPKPKSESQGLPNIELPVSIRIDELAVTDVQIQPASGAAIEIPQLRLQARVAEQVDIQQLLVQAKQADSHFQLTAQGQAGLQVPYESDLKLDWQAHLAQPEQTPLDVNGSGFLRGDVQRLELQHALAQPLSLGLSAVATDIVDAPAWNVDAHTDSLQWPLQGTPQVLVKDFKLHSSGDLQAYTVSLHSQISGEQIPPAEVDLNAKGDLAGAIIEQLRVLTLSGELKAQGKASWQDKLQAEAQISTENIDLRPLWADWPAGSSVQSLLQVQFAEQRLQIEQLQLKLPPEKTVLNAKGEVDLSQEQPDMNLQLDWQQAQWPLQGKAQAGSKKGQATLTGTPQAYQLKLGAQAYAEGLPESHWTLALKGSSEQAQIDKLQGKLLDGELNLTGQAQWAPTLNVQADLQTQQLNLRPLWADWPEGLSLAAQGKVDLQDKDLKLSAWQVRLPEADSQLNLQASAKLTPALPFEAKLDWQQWSWPLLKGESAKIPQGSLQASGHLDDYKLQLDTLVQGKDVPKTQIRAKLSGNLQQAQLQPLRLELLDGYVQASGEVNWANPQQARWQLKVDGADINPGKQWQEWGGKIGLDFSTQGQLKADGVHADVDLRRLDGTLRGYPLDVKMQAQARGTDYQVKQLSARMNQARLQATAQANQQQLQADFSLKVPKLQEIMPDMSGQLDIQGKVRGAPQTPDADVTLQASSLRYQDIQLQSLDSKLRASLRGEGNLDLQLTAKKITQNAQTLLEQVALNAQGDMNAHQLSLQVQHPEAQAKLAVAGSWAQAKQQWQGMLRELTLQNPQAGNWQLREAQPITVTPQQAQIGLQCLSGSAGGQACLQGRWHQTQGSAVKAQIDDLPLALLQVLLPPNLQLSGKAQMHADMQLQANGDLRGESLLQLQPLLTYTLDGQKEPQRLAYKTVELSTLINEQGTQVKLVLDALENSHIKGDLQLAALNHIPLAPVQPLQGHFEGMFADAKLVNLLVPDISDFQGRVEMNLDLGGQLDKPQLTGLLQTRDMALKVPLAGLDLKEIALQLRGENSADGSNQLRVEGSLLSGKGRLALDGKANISAEEAIKAAVNIKGENFEVLNSPMGQVEITPDLKLSFADNQLNLNGKLTIPKAHLTPVVDVGGGSAVQSSPDAEIIIEKPDQAPEEIKQASAPALRLNGQVDVFLGDSIKIEVEDFKSELGGDLRLTFKPEKTIPLADGLVKIEKGTYRAYGQDLSISQGQVIFSGREVSRPSVDIYASRTIYNDPDVEEVGAHITGTVPKVQIDLYSEPSMAESDILAYLLLGSKGLNSGKPTRMSLGMQVLPKLYVSYAFNVVNGRQQTGSGAYVLNARYSFSKHWGVELEVAPEDKGLDMSYEFER